MKGWLWIGKDNEESGHDQFKVLSLDGRTEENLNQDSPYQGWNSGFLDVKQKW
jgi:hypothetical protein